MRLLSVIFTLLVCTMQGQTIIPQPHTQIIHTGYCNVESLNIKATGLASEIDYLKSILLPYTITVSTTGTPLQLVLDASVKSSEGYVLEVTPNQISIKASTAKGIFYGIQSFIQLVPVEGALQIPCTVITDSPKYAWRGTHLDVSRHFFPVDFIKKYIDLLARYKMNVFHWHLTDDQGWRIEIKKYPKLTEIGGYRNGSMVGHYNDNVIDHKVYGGYYTQQQIKEVIAYAQSRHITIVPEIEMPGHALAALTAYPEYSCTGGPFEVGKKWGVFEDVFCPKEETFTFLENILTEVIELFPSEYIHIGGDECPKTRWKTCQHCQKLIETQHLKNEHELQSYFITRIEKFVNSKGRKIIGWDEILEGGLAPNAAVMSWRGISGGIEAAKQNHFVVMSPNNECYFDHYQGEPEFEPVAIGGFTPLEEVYSYSPTPAELAPEQQKYIMGAQANLWTEYVNTPQQAEYMLLPRLLALSEVVWGTANPEKYSDFVHRVQQHFKYFDKTNTQYSKALYNISSKVLPGTKPLSVAVQLQSFDPQAIRYSTQSNFNTQSQAYTQPIPITQSTHLQAGFVADNTLKSKLFTQQITVSKSLNKPITLSVQPSSHYPSDGAFTLVNGVQGNPKKYGKDWLGFSGKDVEILIDLEKPTKVSNVKINFIKNQAAWIYLPKSVIIIGSPYPDNKFHSLATLDTVPENVDVTFETMEIQTLKIIIQNYGTIPQGNEGSGQDAWLFIDEILVN